MCYMFIVSSTKHFFDALCKNTWNICSIFKIHVACGLAIWSDQTSTPVFAW